MFEESDLKFIEFCPNFANFGPGPGNLNILGIAALSHSSECTYHCRESASRERQRMSVTICDCCVRRTKVKAKHAKRGEGVPFRRLFRSQYRHGIGLHRSLRRNEHGQASSHDNQQSHRNVGQWIHNTNLVHEVSEYSTHRQQ